MNEYYIKGQLINIRLSDVFPKESRPLRLWFQPGAHIECCTLGSLQGPDRAAFIDSAGDIIEPQSNGIFSVIAPPAGLLLTWDE